MLCTRSLIVIAPHAPYPSRLEKALCPTSTTCHFPRPTSLSAFLLNFLDFSPFLKTYTISSFTHLCDQRPGNHGGKCVRFAVIWVDYQDLEPPRRHISGYACVWVFLAGFTEEDRPTLSVGSTILWGWDLRLNQKVSWTPSVHVLHLSDRGCGVTRRLTLGGLTAGSSLSRPSLHNGLKGGGYVSMYIFMVSGMWRGRDSLCATGDLGCDLCVWIGI